MKCPKCGGSTAIYGTRSQIDGTVLRYRRCLAPGCWLKFQTRELVLASSNYHLSAIATGTVAPRRRPVEGLPSTGERSRIPRLSGSSA